jgi:Ni/Fe-hydrogenase subunit HybB-like protein
MLVLAGGRVTLGRIDLPLEPRAAAREIGAWTVAEVRSMPVALRLWFGILLALMAAALVAAVVACPPGWEVFGTTPSVEWGLLIVGYVFFAIMTSGLCLASSLGTVFRIDRFRPLEKRHALLALLSLCCAFGIIVLDLHYPIRLVFGAVLSPAPTSPMWWMGVFYGLYLVVLIVEVWSMFTDHPIVHQWACTAAAVIAVLAPTTLGAVFGVIGAKAWWHGLWTPVQMVASAFLAGTSLLSLVFALVVRLRLPGHARARSTAWPALRLLVLLGLVAVTLLVARSVIAGLGDGERGLRAATEALVAGPLAPTFWIGRVGLGLVLPLLLVTVPRFETTVGVALTGILGLVGVFIDRSLLVAAGQFVPVTASVGNVAQPYAWYAPSLVEIAIVLGAASVLAFVYTLAERYLDLDEADTHHGYGLERLDPLKARLRALLARPRAAAGEEAAG